MTTTTDADVRAWLERQADHWMEHGRIASDTLPGIGETGIRPQWARSLLTGALYERTEIITWEFYCTWLGGLEFTTTRLPAKG